jgi:hypothetical protein
MGRINILTLALIATVISCAVITSSAFALEPEWLFKGEVINTAKTTTTSGELLLEDMTASGKPNIICNVLFEGTTGPGRTDSITKIKDSEGKTPLKCTDAAKICNTPAEVTPIHLPWLTELLLVDGTFRNDITNSGAGEPGYKLDCNSILGLVEDQCEGTTSSEATNATEGVEETFNTETETLNCTQGGAKEGLIEGKLLATTTGGTLTVSQE